MRARLAEAAYEVIAERGHSAFRTAVVVAHAGVSQGALLHHFPTKDAVTLAAIEHALGLAYTASMKRLSKPQKSSSETLKLMVEDFRDFFLGNSFWVALDITMDASKDASIAPAIRSIVHKAREPVYQRWAEKLCSHGWERPTAEEAAKMVAALIGGFAIRTLWTKGEEDELDRAVQRLLTLFE